MVAVHVKPLATLRDLLGKEMSVQLDEHSNVRTLLEELFRRFGNKLRERIMEPSSNQVKPYWLIMVNGNNIGLLKKLDTPLKDGDEVLIAPPVAGG